MLQLLSITTDHTCMLRESQTLTPIFLLNHNYLLAPPTYYHLNIAKLLKGIKLIIFSDLHESFYCKRTRWQYNNRCIDQGAGARIYNTKGRPLPQLYKTRRWATTPIHMQHKYILNTPPQSKRRRRHRDWTETPQRRELAIP
jgi:hypothetical protein